MEPKQILSANLLDIIFDDRNKAYGAYELRVTYPERIKKSLLFTFTVGLLAFGGVVLANSLNPKEEGKLKFTPGIILSDLPQEEKKPEPLPEPVKQPEPVQIKTQQYTEFNIVKDQPLDPPPTQDDLEGAKVDLVSKDGVEDQGLADVKGLDPAGTGIIEPKENKEPEIFTAVEVDAKFIGNWERFLLKNLNANVPVDNGAPSGMYKVIIQFIVDVDGNVSDIKALTNHGYGMEQEAIRVLKKATKWEPAFQNNTHVKAYRSQPITFQIESE